MAKLARVSKKISLSLRLLCLVIAAVSIAIGVVILAHDLFVQHVQKKATACIDEYITNQKKADDERVSRELRAVAAEGHDVDKLMTKFNSGKLSEDDRALVMRVIPRPSILFPFVPEGQYEHVIPVPECNANVVHTRGSERPRFKHTSWNRWGSTDPWNSPLEALGLASIMAVLALVLYGLEKWVTWLVKD